MPVLCNTMQLPLLWAFQDEEIKSFLKILSILRSVWVGIQWPQCSLAARAVTHPASNVG